MSIYYDDNVLLTKYFKSFSEKGYIFYLCNMTREFKMHLSN